MTIRLAGGSESAEYGSALSLLGDASFIPRLFAKDATLWGPEAEAEAAVRLGWTSCLADAEPILAEAEALAAEFTAAGVDRVVLCGMGGSSLAPLVIAPSLEVLDSTHPAMVARLLGHDLQRTAVIVSSKSGGTVETLSHLAAAERSYVDAGLDPATRIVVVTDPGSKLDVAATAAGMRVFHADPSVGGRFSVFTAFGIVPTVLAGADMRGLISDASAARAELVAPSDSNPALRLAAFLAAGLPHQSVCELQSDGSLPASLGLWAEQLVAESTGKGGTGILPIALPTGAAPAAGNSSLLVRYGDGAAPTVDAGHSTADLWVGAPLGAQFLLWQVTTAALGFVLGVDPFNQPDVESAKAATRDTLGAVAAPTAPAPDAEATWAALVAAATAAPYVAVHAYVDPGDADLAALLEQLRDRLSGETGVPVAVGYGPRYLHSTGQFHKGGTPAAVFFQLIDAPATDYAIPASATAGLTAEGPSFAELLHAQAQGDAAVLRQRGRAVHQATTATPAAYVRELLAASR